MNSLRITVLEMLAEGRLTIDDADRLLSASVKVIRRKRLTATLPIDSNDSASFLPPALPTFLSGIPVQVF